MCAKSNPFKSYIQWIAAFGVFVLMSEVGITIGWLAPNISKLTANDSSIHLNDDQVSWLVSLSPLGGIAGGFIASMSIESLGGRLSILISFTLLIFSWACMILADSVAWLYLGRGIGGVVAAMTFSSFSIYLGEIVDPEVRGTLISIAAGGSTFGMVVGTITETYLPMKLSSFIYMIPSVLGFVLFLWLRDSPYYLVRIGKHRKAKKSIEFYHNNCNLNDEMQEVKDFVEACASQGFWENLRDLKSPVVRRAMILVVILLSLPHLSGIGTIASYMEVILTNGKSYLIEAKLFVIYANIASVISSLLTFKLADQLGRRILLIISSLGTIISLVGLGIHFLLLKNGVEAKNLEWLPIACILGYLVSCTVGYASVPSVVLGELFTDNFKSIAVLIGMTTLSLSSFVATKAYQPLVDSIGETYVFWIHAALSFMAIPLALFFLPETKGKTFQQIQDALIGK